MANTWAENVHIGDHLNVGEISEAMIEQCSVNPRDLQGIPWLKVLGVQTDMVQNLTTFMLEYARGGDIPLTLTICDSERVTVRRSTPTADEVLPSPVAGPNYDAHLGLHAYLKSQELDQQDYPFYALIATAMRRADSHNLELLRAAWPTVWKDLNDRYNAPGGRLAGER